MSEATYRTQARVVDTQTGDILHVWPDVEVVITADAGEVSLRAVDDLTWKTDRSAWMDVEVLVPREILPDGLWLSVDLGRWAEPAP